MKSGNIRLDPEVLEEEKESRVPLSDLYGIPVFSEDAADGAGKLKSDEKKELAQIRAAVFTADGNAERMRMRQIRRQVFQTARGFTRAEMPERKAGKDIAVNTVANTVENTVTNAAAGVRTAAELTAGAAVFCALLLLFICRRHVLKRRRAAPEKSCADGDREKMV